MRLKKIVLFAAVLLPAGLQAAEVSQERAAATAQSLLAGRISDFNTKVQSVQTVYYHGLKAYHVVQFTRGGWALIAADDQSQPLLGYNGEGTFPIDEPLPENVGGMMDWYATQVVDNARQRGSRHAGWDEAARPAQSRRFAATNKIEPLIKICWNQSGAYQRYCPSNSEGQAVVGCVAVGMAQAMSVAKWPDRPVGNFGYVSATFGSLYIDYDSEPAYNWSDILSGANGLDDVARLLYHCGVSVSMDYGIDGSGSQTSRVATALVRNFKYPSTSVKYYNRDGYSGDWNQLILTELKEGRAVVYSGADLTKNYGHCFNLDGYDGSFYHVNWGWGSPTRYNGYYPLDGLKDTRMDMNYTSQQGAVVGVRAPSDKPSDILLSHNAVQAMKPAGAVVGQIDVVSEAENPTYKFKIVGPYSVVLHTNLPAPFEVVGGQLVTTKELSLEDGDREIEITATNTKNNASVTRAFTILVTATDGIQLVESAVKTTEEIYNLNGVRQTEAKGISVMRQRLSDGSVKTVKRINQ